jgi:hypothetical protein
MLIIFLEIGRKLLDLVENQKQKLNDMERQCDDQVPKLYVLLIIAKGAINKGERVYNTRFGIGSVFKMYLLTKPLANRVSNKEYIRC